MPFPVIVPDLAIADNGSNYVVTDNTVYTIPARNTLGLMLLMVNIRTGDYLLSTANVYNPTTETVFTFSGIQRDGLYALFYWPANHKTGAETPVLNDFVFNAGTAQFERWDGAAWVVATPTDFYLYAQAGATRINNKHNPDFQKALDYLNRSYVNGNPAMSKLQMEELAIELNLQLKGMASAFSVSPSDYQQIIENYYPTVNMVNKVLAVA